MKKIIFSFIILTFMFMTNVKADDVTFSITGETSFEEETTLYLELSDYKIDDGPCGGVCKITFDIQYDYNKIALYDTNGLSGFTLTDNTISTTFSNTTGIKIKNKLVEFKVVNIGLKGGESVDFIIKNISIGNGDGQEYFIDDLKITIKNIGNSIDTTNPGGSSEGNNGGSGTGGADGSGGSSSGGTSGSGSGSGIGSEDGSSGNTGGGSGTGGADGSGGSSSGGTSGSGSSGSALSNNNYLSYITLNHGNLDFNKEVSNYQVQISQTTNSVTITSQAESDKATISGNGIYKLVDNETTVTISVKAENGETRTYNLTFVKSADLTDDTPTVNNKPTTPTNPDDSQTDNTQTDNDNNSNWWIFVLIPIVIIIGAIGTFIIIKKKKNA